MTTTRHLLVGLAEHLAAHGVGVWTVDPMTGYQPDDVAITIAYLPDDPDSCITLTHYPMVDDPSLSDSVAGIQIRTRAGGEIPLDVGDLADAVFDVLHGATGLTLPTGTHIVSLYRRSGTSLGTDQNGRWMRSDNYAATFHAPSKNRT